MCGICGAAVLGSEVVPGLKGIVHTMLAAMRHRGPDGEAIIVRPGLAVAVNRLAIRQTSADHPPLVQGTNGVVIACNGEIDNYRELTDSLHAAGYGAPPGSDVAVLAPLYAERSLAFADTVRGVFAIALSDPRRRRVVLARDRAGERHLYYAIAAGVVYYASELAALMTVPTLRNTVDASALKAYLLRGYCPAPGSAAAGCRKVRPGELVVIDATGVRSRPFWKPPLGHAPKAKPSVTAFDRIFRDSVRRQTDVDVDFGVLLSGGVDSALITAVARAVRPERSLTAYCARFSESSFDEGAHAASVAHDLSCRFVSVNVSAEDVPVTLQHLLESTGELLADPAWIPHAMIARRASKDVPMLLGGEGADELFGGYPTYLGANLARWYACLPPSARRALRAWIEGRAPTDKNMTLSFLLRRFVQGENLHGVTRHRLWTASIAPDLLSELGWDATFPNDSGAIDDMPILDAIQRYDFANALPEALMAKADRGAMCYGVEVRAPFLDTEVIEFTARLPVADRVHGITTKVFLKQYARQYLPRTVVYRRKRGLSVPLAAWLRGPLRAWAHACLARDVLQDHGIDNMAALRLLALHCSHQQDHSRAIWTLIVLSEWLDWHARAPA